MNYLIEFGAVGCSGKPSEMDSTVYEVGCNVADVTQSYLDVEISVKKALEKIEMLQSRIGKEYEDSTNNSIALKIDLISIKFNALKAGVDRAKSLKESLTELKNLLRI